MARTLTFSIFRYDPCAPAVAPRMQEYRLEQLDGMTLFIALNKLREEQDPTLRFDFVCRAAICGSCGMLVNGRPALACKTLTSALPDRITLHPLPVFRLLGDLTVDTGSWFRQMARRTGSWVHSGKPFNPHAPEERMDNELANEIYELDRCIECGCCVAGCGTANIREDFVGAAGLLRIARFMLDPRDERTPRQFFEVVGTDEGIFGCLGLMACQDLCPKQIPLQQQLAYVRRKMARAAFEKDTARA
jgi:fumarate reductase iron-sulfur subunit